MTPEPTPSQELREELTKLLFKTRRSNTVMQDVLIACEVCERPLEDERFWGTEKQQVVEEQSPIVDEIISIFKQHELSRKQEWVEKYDELIMAVGNKYAGETRHETALRYIKSCENSSNTQSKTIKEQSKE